VSTTEAASAGAARRQTLWLFALALGLRLFVVGIAAHRFPPADDGIFYHTVASRIAVGAGYTWAWPDGAVTHAAHYPVGYPALLGGVYALLQAAPWCAMLFNALLGALLVVGVHSAALSLGSLRRARWAALAVALHPTFVLYTAALMTEAAAAAVLVLLAAAALHLRASRRPWWLRALLGVGGGVLVLIRPQLLPMLPVLGAIAIWLPQGLPPAESFRTKLRGALEVLCLGLLCVLPWTLRNCSKMDGCVLVSANGGWNLLIGTLPEARGTFAPIAGATVPPECREVFGEAGKDRCFGQAGARRIREEPVRWLELAPQKLAQLFNHSAIASAYLSTSNHQVFSEVRRVTLATIETLYTRLLLFGAAIGLLRSSGSRVQRTWSLAAAGLSLSPWGFLAQLAVLGTLLARALGRGEARGIPLARMAAALLGLCVVTHMVFFGAARYSLVWLPWLAWLMVLPARSAAPDSSNAGPARVF
jgi:4-amino-4-deoxy-L-arabinose transferase-like glycosyltransferase